MNCISCTTEHQEKFCPNCGEKNGVKKITVSSILEDTFSSVTDMDKGFLFNIKALVLTPQKIINDYISGKRKGILNPISFLILTVTFYIVVITLLKIPKEIVPVDPVSESSLEGIGMDIGKFIRRNLKNFWVLSIIPLGMSLKLTLKKYNFVEYLAISSFIIGQATLAGVISYLIFRFPLIFDPVVYLAILWLVYKIFKDPNDKIESFMISLAALAIFIVLLVIIIALIGVALI